MICEITVMTSVGKLILMNFSFFLFQEETQVRLVGKYIDGLNTLGVIGMSFIFGLALRNMGETGKLLMDIISAVNEATKEVVKMIIGYTDIVPTRRPFNT